MATPYHRPRLALRLGYVGEAAWLLLSACLPLFGSCIIYAAPSHARKADPLHGAPPHRRTSRADAFNPQDEVTTLRPGEALEKRMSSGETHSFKIALLPGQYLRVLIEQHGIDVSAVLLTPAGASLGDVDSPAGAYGPEYVSTISEERGDYTLRLVAVTGRVVSGRYRITIEELREALPPDRGRIDAEKALAEGRRKSPTEAIGEYEKALSYWQGKGDPHWEALALYSISTAYRNSGNTEKALEHLQKALDLAPRLDARDWRLVATLWNDSGLMFAVQGKHQPAVDALNRALSMFREKQDPRGQGSALNNLGFASAKAGKIEEALAYYEEALKFRRAEQDRASEANILNNIGGYYDSLGQPHTAMEYYEQALPILRSFAAPVFEKMAGGVQPDGREKELLRRLAGLTNNIAVYYDKVGEWQLAIENYKEALKTFHYLEDRSSEAATLSNMGTLYFALGATDRALELLEQSLRLTRGIVKDPNAIAERLINLGKVHVAQGNLDGALAGASEALSLSTNDRMRAAALTSLGTVRALRNDPRAAIGPYDEAVRLQRESGNRRDEAAARLRRGEARAKLKEQAAALEDLNEALSLSKAVADPLGEADALRAIARVELDRDNLNGALARSGEALDIIERLRTKVASQRLRTSYLETIQDYFEAYIDISMRLYRQTGRPEHAADALQASERARARSLVDALLESGADIRQGVSAQLISDERELQRRLNAKAQEQLELLSGKHTAEKAASVSKELEELVGEYDRVRAEISKTSPKYAGLTQPPPPTLRDIRERLLDDDTLLLEYELGEERSYLWVLDRTTITGHELPKRAEVEAAARRLYDLMSAEQPRPGETTAERRRRLAEAEAQYPSEAAALSRTLLGDVADRISGKRLLIVGDGLLHYLPFGALPVPVPDRGGKAATAPGATTGKKSAKLLLEKCEIVSLPSVTSALLLSEGAVKGDGQPLSVVVFADPILDPGDPRLQRAKKSPLPGASPPRPLNVPAPGDVIVRDGFSLAPLPLALEEARAIENVAGRSRLVLGLEANRAAVSNLPPDKYRVIHFATHGMLNETHPELSGIVLSLYDEAGAAQDGVLRLHDIYNLKLPAALVVLSACRTGLGRLVRGEGLIGLTRGFMYAGSPRVVASVWKVDDSATKELMERFYKFMFKRGMSPAAALRHAQLEMLSEKRWKSPYNWAAFILHGEWRDVR